MRTTLYCFDIDGTIAESEPYRDLMFSGHDSSASAILSVRAYPNILKVATQAIMADNAHVMFCTGRGTSMYGLTWRWLNRHLRIAESGKRVSVVCRPEVVSLGSIPQFKLSEIVQAIRRCRPAELRCYDDSLDNLRLFGTLAPMVKTLRLFRCENGVASAWSL